MTETAAVIKLDERRPYMKADIENGFDRLAHDLTDAFINPPVKLSTREIQVVFAIIAKTYRFHKKMDWISNVQISDLTGIAANHVSEIKAGLIAKNILLEEGREIGINPVISDWEKPPKNRTKKSQNWEY